MKEEPDWADKKGRELAEAYAYDREACIKAATHAIAKALRDERERCAQIADAAAEGNQRARAMDRAGVSMAIASAIRDPNI